MKARQRFRGPTAAPAPFQPASPEETAAALEAAKVSREEAARRASQAQNEAEEKAPEQEEVEAPEKPEIPEKRATVVCAEDQLSLAIGRSGQNVRLASKLTGYRIDLVSKADYLAQEEEALFGRRPEAVEPAAEKTEEFALADIPGIDAETAAALASRGYRSFDDIINMDHEELAAIPGISPETATKLMSLIDELTVEVEEEWDDEEGDFVPAGEGPESPPAEASAEVLEEQPASAEAPEEQPASVEAPEEEPEAQQGGEPAPEDSVVEASATPVEGRDEPEEAR